MDNADYVTVALRIANADLSSLDAVRAAVHDEPWWADRLGEADLPVLRTVADGLRRALDAMVGGDGQTVLAEINTLLSAHPPRPRLSGHGGRNGNPNWHVHVAGPDAPAVDEVAAAAAWGLAQGVVHHGTDRWGRCQADGCDTYYLDTSTNQAKRFCSPRCANRMHVAAFRARRRE
ncbi:CGNR zinc finger domain-containing protein [Saccharopolyspora antimicrobica]|uniref:CGNR zinc finger domain-containing protein n=1 Tax=Saccharopolyspora antimicrobica TaxID=455193 RepID=A0A1I4STY6_9PSEU|nr:CGNR zinc finger domain-containing protein [Saccharopolyspora antimicrobica]RKT86003.1 CGNR zinc finger protein [Saccharopolyspora antimicrobica]SFM67956.1 CGNR zinc finger domain-containing protein [Saccharopolyspora antimicrobica]